MTLAACTNDPKADNHIHEHTHSNELGETWYVSRLIKLSEDLLVKRVPLSQFTDMGWTWEPVLKLSEFAEHVSRVQRADLSYPVILDAKGNLMDGAHRLVKAHTLGAKTILCVQFCVNPKPDWVETPRNTSAP